MEIQREKGSLIQLQFSIYNEDERSLKIVKRNISFHEREKKIITKT